MNLARSRWLDSAWRVTAFYTLAAIATTWPLVTRLTTSLPSDLGDPLLNCFIIDWGVDHLRTLADGNLGAFRDYWDAPIFHPEPLALAYSEHLFAQAIQAAPIVWATDNILLAYNFLFLSTFVLSGLGMYLLSRELTGSGAAGFVAGLLYAFALYRVAQYPHLQALSSQWLPFVFFGLRRFFVTGSFRTLAGATTALAAQNLSNGYYLIFFTPFVAAYCIYEIADRRLWTNLRVLAGLTGAGLLTILVTLPFLVPYLVLRWSGFDARALSEVRSVLGGPARVADRRPAQSRLGMASDVPEGRRRAVPGRRDAAAGRGGARGTHSDLVAALAARQEAMASARRRSSDVGGCCHRDLRRRRAVDRRRVLDLPRTARDAARAVEGGGAGRNAGGIGAGALAIRADDGRRYPWIGPGILRRGGRGQRRPHLRPGD